MAKTYLRIAPQCPGWFYRSERIVLFKISTLFSQSKKTCLFPWPSAAAYGYCQEWWLHTHRRPTGTISLKILLCHRYNQELDKNVSVDELCALMNGSNKGQSWLHESLSYLSYFSVFLPHSNLIGTRQTNSKFMCTSNSIRWFWPHNETSFP